MHDLAIIAASVCLSLAAHAAIARVIRTVRRRRAAPRVRRLMESIESMDRATDRLYATTRAASDSMRGRMPGWPWDNVGDHDDDAGD